MHHHGAGDVIPQPPAVPVQHHARNPDRIQRREDIDRPHEIPADGLERIDRPAGLLDHSDVRDAFSGRLAFPERFEERKVSPVHTEQEQQHQRGRVRPGERRHQPEPRTGEEEAHVPARVPRHLGTAPVFPEAGGLTRGRHAVADAGEQEPSLPWRLGLEDQRRIFREQQNKLVTFSMYGDSTLDSVLAMLGDVQERLTHLDATSQSLAAVRKRAEFELESLQLTKGIEEAKVLLQELQAKQAAPLGPATRAVQPRSRPKSRGCEP